MGTKTGISWTGSTWNITGGCTKVSPACANCYAAELSNRFGWTTLPWTTANEAANISLIPSRLSIPSRWSEGRSIFVDSTSDLLHRGVDDDFIVTAFAIMARTSRHTYQVLTKRSDRLNSLFSSVAFWDKVASVAESAPVERGYDKPAAVAAVATTARADRLLPNVHLGVSVENSRFARRADDLRSTPAARRFISAEPLLGSLSALNLRWIDQIIVGGEYGRRPRLMKPEWVDEARELAASTGAAFFFKQTGNALASELRISGRGTDPETWPERWHTHQSPSRLSATEARERESARISGDVARWRSFGSVEDDLVSDAA